MKDEDIFGHQPFTLFDFNTYFLENVGSNDAEGVLIGDDDSDEFTAMIDAAGLSDGGVRVRGCGCLERRQFRIQRRRLLGMVNAVTMTSLWTVGSCGTPSCSVLRTLLSSHVWGGRPAYGWRERLLRFCVGDGGHVGVALPAGQVARTPA